MTPQTTGLCDYCMEPLVGADRSSRRFCPPPATCRQKFHAAKNAPREPSRRQGTTCRCNGSQARGFDLDGFPRCDACGAEIDGPRRMPRPGFGLDLLKVLMDAPVHRVCRPRHQPWESAHQRPNFTTDIRVYSGLPFDPDSEVEVVPASSFSKKGSSK